MSCAMFTFSGVFASAFKTSSHWIVGSLFVMAGIAVIVAIALAWRDEHNKLLLEQRRNALPKFSVEVERIVYSVPNSNLLFLCSVVNQSEKRAGLRSAELSDILIPLLNGKKADEAFKSATLYNSDEKRIEVEWSAATSRSVKESLGVSTVNNLLVSASPLLEQGRRERGWLAFAGVKDLEVTGMSTTRLSVKDTLGGLHETSLSGLIVERMSVLA